MADYQAVALGIKPADPNQAFNSINSILGMQQTRQQLQIQAQQLQQEQLKTEGQQGAAEYFKDFDPTQWVTANGTTDVNGIMAGDAKFKGLNGVAKPMVMDQLQKMQGHQLENMRTLGQMDADTVTDFAQRANTWAQNPEVQNDTAEGRKYVQAEIQKYGLLDPQKAKIAGIYGKAFADPAQGGAKQGHLAPALTAMGAQAQTVSEQQTQSNPEGTTNAGGQIINRDRRTGALSAAPTGGNAAQLNPSSPTVAAATRTAAGTAEDDNTRANAISSTVAPSRTSITLADQVAKLADEVRTGKFSDTVTKYAATIGQKDETIAARQLLSKYAAQLKTQGISNAPSDTARNQIEAGLPDPDTMSPEAIKGAAEFVKGGMLMNLSRAANARKFSTTHGNTQGLRMADDRFTSNADPLMYTYQNLPKGPARTEFIQRHFKSADDKNDFIRRKNVVEHYGGFEQ